MDEEQVFLVFFRKESYLRKLSQSVMIFLTK